jgi:hypothetical protein
MNDTGERERQMIQKRLTGHGSCFRLLMVFVVLAFLGPPSRGGSSSPLTPEAERKSFRLADANLVVELVAAEPDVVSPVAIAWDEDGQLYVAEMTDYPAATTGGCVRRLGDRDGVRQPVALSPRR